MEEDSFHIYRRTFNFNRKNKSFNYKNVMAASLKMKIRQWAILTRLLLFIIHLLFNSFIPDHESDAFHTPVNEETNFLDSIINFFFAGLSHWDGQHFLHISNYGYTYENNLAFFPLYPLLIKTISNTIGYPLQTLLSYHNVTLLSGILINFVCFVLSAEIFYELSRLVLKEEKLAYKASLLYCVNPASIFFSALYTESLFAICVFTGMLFYEKESIYLSSLCFCVGGAARSNSVINCGFPIYYTLNKMMKSNNSANDEDLKFKYLPAISEILKLVVSLCVIFVPFFAHQVYAFVIFCTGHEPALTSVVKEFAIQNGLKIPSEDFKPSWCFNSIPISYNNIQEKYWNVGFLKYYEWKQIPNFLLATPITILVICAVIQFYKNNRRILLQLGLGKVTDIKIGIDSPKLFVYIVHGTVQLIFGWLFINIQVITRFLCASSPMVYWFAASFTSKNTNELRIDKFSDEEITKKIETQFNLSNWGRNVLIDQIHQWDKCSTTCKLIITYFLSYFVIGVAMFVNGLPFT